jgi:3-isopropylmalate dehydrogenase
VHGSAPDLAGKNLANPIAAILSIAMMLGITFKEKKISSDIYKAVNGTLEEGMGTIDIVKDDKRAISTTDFTDKIINKYRSIVEN